MSNTLKRFLVPLLQLRDSHTHSGQAIFGFHQAEFSRHRSNTAPQCGVRRPFDDLS